MPTTRSRGKEGARKEANTTPVFNETKPVTKDETNSVTKDETNSTDEQTKKTVKKKDETTKQTEKSTLPIGYENLKHPALVGVIKELDTLCKAPKPAKGKILQNEKFVSQFRDLQDILEGLTEQRKEPLEHETHKTKKRKQSGISAELESSQLRIHELEKKNNELEASLKQFEEKNQKLHKQIEEATDEINKETREYEEKLQQLTNLSKDNGKLREMTKNFEATIEAKNKKLESHSRDLIARSDFIKQQQKEYDALKNQLQQLQNEIEKKNDQINGLRTEIVRKKDEHDILCADFQKKNMELETEIEKKTEEITALKDDIKKKNDELDELRNRLSAVSASRLDGDPSLTDLGDKNRPLKLVDRYQQLYDNLWTDVYDELLESYPDLDSSEQEKEAASDILSIFMNVKKFCEQTISKQEKDITASLLLCSENSEVMLHRALRLGLVHARTQASDGCLTAILPSCIIARQPGYTCVLGISHIQQQGRKSFHTSSPRKDDFDPEPDLEHIPKFPNMKPKEKWLKFNEIVYPPQKLGDPVRPAEITHITPHIKYSPKKLWYFAIMIRGMTVDEAIKQLSFQKHKGAHIIKEAIEECQEAAVKDHNVEFKSNLWIEDSFVRQSMIFYGYRIHARKRASKVAYRYSHYFLRLREGKPPEHYYPPPETGYDKMETYIKDQRKRRIVLAL